MAAGWPKLPLPPCCRLAGAEALLCVLRPGAAPASPQRARVVRPVMVSVWAPGRRSAVATARASCIAARVGATARASCIAARVGVCSGHKPFDEMCETLFSSVLIAVFITVSATLFIFSTPVYICFLPPDFSRILSNCGCVWTVGGVGVVCVLKTAPGIHGIVLAQTFIRFTYRETSCSAYYRPCAPGTHFKLPEKLPSTKTLF